MVGIPEDLRDQGETPALDAIRTLRQQLELNRDFGWDMPVTADPARGPVEDSPAADRAGVGARPPAGEETGTAVRETAAAPGSLPGADKGAALQPVEAEVAGCTLCSLCEGRSNTVFGVGDPGARLLFVGEGPGRDEDLAGEPFVGKAGQLLNDIIKAMGLKREQVYIANIVKCRPPENRNPVTEEIAACMPYLRRQVEIIQPEVICALGGVAAKALLSSEASVGSLRGKFHDYDGIAVRVTYHPAYLLRSPHEKSKTWQDIKAVMGRLSLALPS
ncbi:MAG: uracil-DNA glycosylase [Planctomycetota bacterium]|nr:uracil-DNA glycosylase [Planctomycetota bacterium]